MMQQHQQQQQQQQQYHSSADYVATVPYIIPSHHHHQCQQAIQVPSYSYDTVYPAEQQVAINVPPPPASVMQGKNGCWMINYSSTDTMIDNAIFSRSQLEALKNQIFAFKLLSRDMPIPQHIMEAVMRPLPCSMSTNFIMAPTTTTQQHQLPPTPIEEKNTSSSTTAMDASTIVVSPPTSKYSLDEQSTISPPLHPPPINTQESTMYNAYASPYSLFNTHISSFMHATSLHRQMVPSIMPVGVDPLLLHQERENAIHGLMQGRYEELSDWERQFWMMLDPQQYDDDFYIKALMEHKALKLAERQKQVWFNVDIQVMWNDSFIYVVA